MKEIDNLQNFLVHELGASLSPDRDEPSSQEIFRTKDRKILYQEDFFILVPGMEEPDIWEKIRDFYSQIAESVFEKQEGSLIAVKDEDKTIMVSGSYYNEEEFRVIVNVW